MFNLELVFLQIHHIYIHESNINIDTRLTVNECLFIVNTIDIECVYRDRDLPVDFSRVTSIGKCQFSAQNSNHHWHM